MIITTSDYQNYTGTTLNPAQTLYVNNLIPVIQNQIEIYCDRLFDAQDYYEWYKYSRSIVLRQYPVNNIKYFGEVDKVAEFSSDDYNYEITRSLTTNLPETLIVTDAALSSTTVTFGGAITTLTDIKTAIETALPAITLTITAGFETLNYKLLRIGTGKDIYGAKRNDAQIKLIEDENRTVEILMDSAFSFWVELDRVLDTNIFVVYNAGYSSINMPLALKLICVNIIKDVMNIQGITTGPGALSGLYKSEDITNYSYTMADGVVWQGSIDIASIVSKYFADLDSFRKKTI